MDKLRSMLTSVFKFFKRQEERPMSMKRKAEESPNPAKKPKYEDARGNEGAEIRDCLENFSLDFDCAVAVWLHGLREMSNEEVQFLNLITMDYSCVSRCYKLRMRKKRIGAIFMFDDEVSAAEFGANLRVSPSPQGDYPFRAENLGKYLRTVADIENQLGQIAGNASIIVRNLNPLRRVTKRVVQLCSIVGDVQGFEVFPDVGEDFKFQHVLVSYKYAVQAFAAKLALDGKWISEQKQPLEVEVLKTDKVKAIYHELLIIEKMLFSP